MTIKLAVGDTTLDEIVVTGYGSARKLGSIVGSVTAVSGDIVENSPVANIGDALQGQVAGLQVFTSSGEPSSSASMRIRGVSSINSSSEPLFILDGSPISSGAFTALNPNDIETMTVLKDASATAIYGSRAANGVVILTTKKGKRGQKAKVQVSAQYGISKMTGDRMDMMNAEEWLNFQEMLDPSMKNNAAFQAEKQFYIDNGISTDWADVFFGGSAPMQQYDLSITGGTEALNYYLSFSHYDADGIMDDSNLRRETLRSNIDASINQWIRVGANLSLSYQKYITAAFGGTANSVYNKAHASRIYRPDQSYYEILRNEDGSFAGYGDRLDYFDKLGYYNPQPVSKVMFPTPNLKTGLSLQSAVYLSWGYVSAARQAAFDANMVTPGMHNPAQLKILVLTNMALGSPEVAEKYVNILAKTLFHRGWAREMRQALDEPAYEPEELRRLREALPYKGEYVRYDGLKGDMKDILEADSSNEILSQFYTAYQMLETLEER
jgi:TonB-dependent SusC/RagA subfamily outer membrane receptor